MLVRENVPLAPLTTLQVGGAARFFVGARTETEVRDAISFARSRRLPLFILGGGSNLVVADSGWPGLVLKIDLAGIDETENAGLVRFRVAAGEDWDRFVARAVAHNCAGVECLSGIPGTAGGTPVQNVGAYGQEVSETIRSVRALALESLDIEEFTNEQCKFAYRSSIFNTTERGRYAILSVTCELTRGGAPLLKYADLQRHFQGWSVTPTLADVREAVRRIRATKAMLLTPGDEDSRSAGSFFKNPVLGGPEYQLLCQKAEGRKLRIPAYPAADSQHKISAAWLVEHSGFQKGYVHGNVGISRKHALAIVNRGAGTAREIVELKTMIQQRVEELWEIRLEAEPVLVGF